MAITWPDLLVVIAYLATITIIGARFRKSQPTLREYFLGGRRSPWWAICFAIVTAETSILTIISTPGIAYRSNLAFLQLIFGYLVGRVIVSFALIPRYFAGEIFTAYQLIERRFGRGLKVFTAGLFLVTRALSDGVRVFAIAIVIGVIFKSGVFASVLIVAAVALFYTFEGGLTAVIWTDLIQLFIYLTGSALALAMALHAIPGGWAEVTRLAYAEGNKLAVFNFHFNWHEPYLFWSGLVGGAFLNTATHGTDQLIVQFLLAARKKRESQAALISSAVVILLQFTLFLLVGTVLFAFYRHFPPARAFARSDQIFPAFVLTQLPRGLAGLLIAAIIAPGMASLSASFNSLATTSVMDFYKPFIRPNADERHYIVVSRGMVLAWGAVLGAIALVAQHLQRSVMEVALTVASVPYGSMLGIFLLGVLTKRATGRGALTGALVALAVMVFVVAYTPLAWTWYVAVGTVVTFTVGWVASGVGEGTGNRA